jgi:hypothetical protein
MSWTSWGSRYEFTYSLQSTGGGNISHRRSVLFFGYDFWEYRHRPRFRAGVLASIALHGVVLAAAWPLLPMHLLWVLGIGCVERFGVMLVCFKFMEREN